MNGHVHDELPALLAGEPPAAAAAVHAHLAGCDRCRLDLAAVAFAAGELRSTAWLLFADPAELRPCGWRRRRRRPSGGEGPPTAAGAAGRRRPAGGAGGGGGRRVTDDGLDPAYQATRQGAYTVAAREGARVVLFGPLARAVPGRPLRAGQGNGGRLGARCSTRQGLEPAGRPYPGRAVAEPLQLGLDGAAWVARGARPQPWPPPCEVLEAERVVLPAILATPAPDRPGPRPHPGCLPCRVPARITLADLDGILAEVD